MTLIDIVYQIEEGAEAALFGLFIGTLFGICARRSRICLRAAVLECARGNLGDKTALCLLTFSTALFWVQGSQHLGLLDARATRMMAVSGELKFQGFENTANMRQALIEAALMGFGGMLARRCAICTRITGGSIFAGTAWAALTPFWIGRSAANILLNQRDALVRA